MPMAGILYIIIYNILRLLTSGSSSLNGCVGNSSITFTFNFTAIIPMTQLHWSNRMSLHTEVTDSKISSTVIKCYMTIAAEQTYSIQLSYSSTKIINIA